MKTNIALIGFMGAGKTRTGKTLAQKLRLKSFELDNIIEKKAGKSISRIFSEDGETAFRNLESEVVKDISAQENAVIACGGGVVLNKTNIDNLRKNAIIVYLETSPEIISFRLKASGDKRPLLNTTDRERRIEELLKQRKPLYEQAADIKITINELDLDTADLIIKELKASDSIDFKK
jgi:shikimate kinase